MQLHQNKQKPLVEASVSHPFQCFQTLAKEEPGWGAPSDAELSTFCVAWEENVCGYKESSGQIPLVFFDGPQPAEGKMGWWRAGSFFSKFCLEKPLAVLATELVV